MYPPVGSVVDRRSGLDRRDDPQAQAARGGEPTGAERRRGPGRRLSDFSRAAEAGELTREQFLFVKAIDEFKRSNGVMFPAWTDVLEVIRLLGYRKTMPSELKLGACEDWREAANTASGVRPENWQRRFSEKELAALGEMELELGEGIGDAA